MASGDYALTAKAINKITVKWHFHMWRLDDLIDLLHGATIFSKIDLKSRYHQVRICPNDKRKTAFNIHEGLLCMACNVI